MSVVKNLQDLNENTTDVVFIEMDLNSRETQYLYEFLEHRAKSLQFFGIHNCRLHGLHLIDLVISLEKSQSCQLASIDNNQFKLATSQLRNKEWTPDFYDQLTHSMVHRRFAVLCNSCQYKDGVSFTLG